MSVTLVNNITEVIGELVRSTLTPLALPIVEMNLIPDVLLRFAIRREIAMVISIISQID